MDNFDIDSEYKTLGTIPIETTRGRKNFSTKTNSTQAGLPDDWTRVSSSPVIPRSAAKENTTRQTISDKNEAVCDLIRKNYERTDDPERFTTPTSILDFIIKKMPDTNGKEGEVGKVVRFVFGNDVTTGNRTKDGKTLYKITCIDPQQ